MTRSTTPARSDTAPPSTSLAPALVTDAEAVALLGADGAELDALCARADALRHDLVGDHLTYVVNRNLDTARVGAGTDASRDLVRALVVEAVGLGATEVCLQGPLPPGAPDDGYLDLVRTISAAAVDAAAVDAAAVSATSGSTAVTGIHLHAFRPAEVADAADRLGLTPVEFLRRARDAGLGSVPGTGAKILDDDVRALLAGGPDLPVARWIELVGAAHSVGLTSTATMVYGHVETPQQQVAHLRTLAAMAERAHAAGHRGFTEFIPMPYVPGVTGPTAQELPAGSRPGPDLRETRAVVAVARLLLAGRIDHVQAPWPKVGTDAAVQLLRGGADDLGGLLLDGVLDPSAGQEQGVSLTRAEVDRIADALGRPVRQRTTRYDVVEPEPSA